MVVTGDHGEGLGERHWAHGWHLYDEDIRIPMLLFDTAGTRYPDLSFATQVDIAPTILDRLRLPIPASWDGQSLLAPAATRVTYHQTYFMPNRFAVLYRDARRPVQVHRDAAVRPGRAVRSPRRSRRGAQPRDRTAGARVAPA